MRLERHTELEASWLSFLFVFVVVVVVVVVVKRNRPYVRTTQRKTRERGKGTHVQVKNCIKLGDLGTRNHEGWDAGTHGNADGKTNEHLRTTKQVKQ